jgi:hypothetical protein
MDLSPSRDQGGQSHFRGGQIHVDGEIPHAAKIGTVPAARFSDITSILAAIRPMSSPAVTYRAFGPPTAFL